jgi:DNA-binding winged helix-turn-helix (wHTH) protein/TolB-like protein
MDQELTYRLGESTLDLSRGTLRRAGELVTLRPKTLKLLGYLAHNPGRVVGKDELLDAIWPRTTVTEDSLTQCVRDARKSISDEDRTIIRTVSRRGYIYVPATDRPVAMPTPCPAPDDLDLEPAEPRVAVLPFRLTEASRAMKPAFDTVVQEITAALSTSRAIAVRRPPRGIWSSRVDAGVDYYVEGHVQGGDPFFSVMITLSDAKSGCRLLTQTFFLKAEGILAFHQTVARQVVSALVFNIETAAWQWTPQGSTSLHVW